MQGSHEATERWAPGRRAPDDRAPERRAPIVQVEVGRYDYTVARQFKFFRPAADGKTYRPSVLVRLTDENGVQGWGQAVPVQSWTYETAETVETTLRCYLAEAILGVDPADLAGVHVRMEAAIRPSFTVGQPLCKAAIDLACYDLAGKQAGMSVAALLGGARLHELGLSWTVNSPDMAGAEAQLAEGRARGYRSFNVKVGPPQAPDYDLALVRTVQRFAPNGFHWCDANTGYSVETALAMAPRLADAGMRALESPLPPNRLRGYQALVRQGAIPIYMDEGVITPVEAEEFAALGMFHGITMKVARCGGLWHAGRMANMLRERGLGILASGLCDPDLSFAASLHLFAAIGLELPLGLNGPEFLADSLAQNGNLMPEGNTVLLPAGPGLGVTLNAGAEAALTVAAAL